LYDSYLLQETHLRHEDIECAEEELSKIGLKSCFTAARPSRNSAKGSHGGVTVITKNHFQAKFFRELGKQGTVSAATAGRAPTIQTELLDYDDWIPMLWHMRGYSILVISIYLECHKPLRSGPNADRLKELGKFLSLANTPWIIAGDFNTSPADFAASGWPAALGDGKILTLDGGACTCFKKDATPSLIDFFVVSPTAQHHIDGLEAVSDVPWGPHIGQVLTLKGELQFNMVRQLHMPKPFHHQRLPKKAPDPASKRQQQRALRPPPIPEAGSTDINQSPDGCVDYDELLSKRWEALTPEGWMSYPTLGVSVTPVAQATTLDDDIDPMACLTQHEDEPEELPPELPPELQPDPDALEPTPEHLEEDSELEQAEIPDSTPTNDTATDVDTRTLNDLWDTVCGQPAATPVEPPDYITDCAAYRATGEAALRVGNTFQQATHQLESFYCEAYDISSEDQALYRGRGTAYELRNTEQREKGQRRMRYSTYSANWWARAVSATSVIATMKRRQADHKEVKALAACCRRLAQDGVPTAGAKASPTARLHRHLWKTRLQDMEAQSQDVLDGMAQQAQKEEHNALRYELRRSGKEYAKWLSDTCDNGTMHRMTKPKPRHEDEMVDAQEKACSTLERLDLKARTFEEIWSSKQEKHDDHVQLLQELREQAQHTTPAQWTVDQFDTAIIGIPDSGKGTDRLSTSDARRLPAKGRNAIVNLLNDVEAEIAWPWQTMQSIVMIQPKPSSNKGPSAVADGGDRALALLPWLCRTWELMHRESVRTWAQEVEEPWDAAIAGNSCLREAMIRALGDEVADAFGIHSSIALLDIKRFYDSLSFPKIVKAAAEFGFPTRILALSLQFHLTPRFLRLDNCYSQPLYADKSLLAGARHSNNLARALVYHVMRQYSSRITKTQPRTWFDDIGVQTFGTRQAVHDTTIEATAVLHEELRKQDLDVAAKSVIITSDPSMTKQIIAELANRGIIIDGSNEGRDLGVDRASKTCSARKTHRLRKKKAWTRIALVGRRFRKAKRGRIKGVLEQGAMASILYGSKVYGASPNERLLTRRKYAKALRRAWPGRCLTTLISIEGQDPEVTTIKAQFAAWFDLWAASEEVRVRIKRAWPVIKRNLAKHDERKRWQVRRGIMGSIILMLWELGWDPKEADFWTDPKGDGWQLSADEADGDPTDILDLIGSQVELRQWRKASKHHNGSGLEHGADLDDLRRHLKGLESKGKHQRHGALLTAACAGTWTQKRKADAYGTPDLCECGQVEDDYHRIWGNCPCRKEHVIYQKTDHLKGRAYDGQFATAAFWLRGITPRQMTCPPPCDTDPTDTREGEAINGILTGTNLDPLQICGDGSGGAMSSDRRYRRCGWGWALMREGQVRAAARGPLPGARQTNNRAELWALLHALQSSTGTMIFWTDSEVLIRCWRQRRYQVKRYHRGNGDIWRLIKEAIQTRGGTAEDISIHHMRSHTEWEEADARGVPRWAWKGNREADERADQAAEEHAIPAAQLNCYEWARAVGQLVRQRITQATFDVIERRQPMTWDERDQLRKEAKLKKGPTKTFDQLAQDSTHTLTKTSTGWKCTACAQSAIKRRTSMARWWLATRCSASTAEVPRSFSLKGRCAHHTHHMTWSRKEKGHFCYNCGGTAKQYISDKLAEDCKPPQDKSRGHYVVRALRKHA